ncbi:MAG: hypothetical protein GON13_01975 [Nanoarchaeota archaeon]|nr:hypothetical protein [Nanoarchaeota archaeon]
MQKQELLNSLKYAWELEESHIPVILNFFLDDFNWENIEESKVKRVKQILKTIKSQTLNHSNILNELMQKIKESDEDEF